MMINWVARVNPSHPYLENDPAPSFDPHLLRISPWLWFRSHALTGQAVVLGLFLCPFSPEGRWPDLGLMPGIPRRPPGLAFPSRLSIRRCNWAMVYCCWAMTANKTSEGQIEDCIHAVGLP